jgi:hypothetical protein
MEHHAGAPSYDPRHPPVVVYFRACNDDDTVGSKFRPYQSPRREPGWKRLLSRMLPEGRRS